MTTEINSRPDVADPPRPTRAAPTGLPWGRPTAPEWAAAATALVLGLLWAGLLAGVGGDLAAQRAWTDFAALHPGSAYDLAWYGGMHPASYSLLAPRLMALLGVRAVGVGSAAAAAALLARLVVRSGVRRPMPVALWGAFALSCNLAAGRVTFALGTAFALAALVAAGAGRRRMAAGAALALLATAASPVAGLFVEVAAAALLLTGRRRTAMALAVPPLLVVLTTSLLFPFHGVDPIEPSTVLVSVGSATAVLLFTPRRWRTVRRGAAVYAVGTVLTWLIPTPIGSNVQRLGLLFGGVVLLAALTDPPPGLRPRSIAALAAFAATVCWTVNGNLVGIPAASSTAQAAGLLAELRSLHAERGRLEAVPQFNHWESAGLAPAVELARGWNRQLDVDRNPLFYDGTLTAPGYRDWLRRWAVQYVALPAGPLDDGGEDEAALIRTGLPWLQQVWQDGNWRLYRFTDALPLAAPPATVDHADAAEIELTVSTPGPVPLKVAWSPWLTVHGPSGACLARDGDWTRLDVAAPGTYRIDAPYRLTPGRSC